MASMTVVRKVVPSVDEMVELLDYHWAVVMAARMEAQTENTWAGWMVGWMVGRKAMTKDRRLVQLLVDLKEDLSDLYRAEAACLCSSLFASDVYSYCQQVTSSEKTPVRTQLNSIVGKEKPEFEVGKQLKPSFILLSTQLNATKISNVAKELTIFTAV